MRFLKQFWLNFCQAVTILLAVIYVVRLYIPTFPTQLFQPKPKQTVIQQAPQQPVQHNKLARSYSHAAKTAMPAVVNIFTSKQPKVRDAVPLLNDPLFRFFFGERLKQFENTRKPQTSLGSGVIVSHEGLILTNHHVVADADQIEVALSDGRKLVAHRVGSDPESDLALLKVNATELPVITFANIKNLAIGDVVLAIGNPFGVGQTVTQGIVSALGRDHLGINTFENFIQTDASINPGNSGGALVNTLGHLIGINTAIYSKSGGSMGIGFAIPATLAQNVLQQIVANGQVIRGWIGIETQDVNPALAESFNLETNVGTIVTGVLRNGPADQANLQPGDIILNINEQAAINSEAMLQLIASLKPNDSAKLTVLRDGKTLEINVKIGTRPTRN